MKARVPPWWTTVAVLAVAVLAFDGLAAYRISGREERPEFRLGGQFGEETNPPAAFSVDGADPAEAAPAAVPRTVVATTTTARSPVPPRTAAPTTTRPTTAASSPTTALAAPRSAAPPAPGVYTYALAGTESATLAGARGLGPQLTITAHGASGLGPNQVVLDYVFSPDHKEREVLNYDPSGVSFAFEGGSVSFGAISQTSQADYTPPMLQVPFPLVAGSERQGTTTARDAGGGATRTEDWVVRIVRQETLTVLGSAVPTWVVAVDRKTRAGSAEQVSRSRTYWYDPGRNIWVKLRERFSGQRSLLGLSFGFTADFEAVLNGFTAG